MADLSANFQRARDWLDANAFPSAPPSPKVRFRWAAALVVIFVGLVVVQLFRMWSSVPLNSIWGEDGYIFLSDAIHKSFLTALTTPYNGYLQTSSRLVAEPISHLPVSWFAPALAISGSVLVAAYALILWKASAGHIRNPYLRGVLAALVVLLPVVGVETLDNVVNSIWFLFFLSFWILLWRPATKPGAIGAGLLLFLAVVSNGGTLLLLPLWLMRLLAARDSRDRMIVGGYAIGVVLQLALSWNNLNQVGEGHSAISYKLVCRFANNCHGGPLHWTLLPAYLQRVVGGAVLGQNVGGYVWVHIGVAFELILAVGVVVFVIVALRRGSDAVRFFVVVSVLASLGIFIVSGQQRWPSAGAFLLWPEGVSNTAGSHYIVVPALLLLSALLVFLDGRPRSVSPATWTKVQMAGAGVLLALSLVSFAVGDRVVRGHPTWSRSLTTARARCLHERVQSVNVEINPPSLRTVTVSLPCDRLEGS